LSADVDSQATCGVQYAGKKGRRKVRDEDGLLGLQKLDILSCDISSRFIKLFYNGKNTYLTHFNLPYFTIYDIFS